MAKKSNAGAPSKYKPEYCQLLIEHMAEGLSFESFAALADVDRSTLYEWEEVHKEFSDAKKRGEAKSLLKWEGLGIKHILNESESSPGIGGSSKSLNAAVYRLNMINRFRWKDRAEVETSVVVNNYASLSEEDLDQKIAEKKKLLEAKK